MTEICRRCNVSAIHETSAPLHPSTADCFSPINVTNMHLNAHPKAKTTFLALFRCMLHSLLLLLLMLHCLHISHLPDNILSGKAANSK